MWMFWRNNEAKNWEQRAKGLVDTLIDIYEISMHYHVAVDQDCDAMNMIASLACTHLEFATIFDKSIIKKVKQRNIPQPKPMMTINLKTGEIKK